MAAETHGKAVSAESRDLEQGLRKLRELCADASPISNAVRENVIRAVKLGKPARGGFRRHREPLKVVGVLQHAAHENL